MIIYISKVHDFFYKKELNTEFLTDFVCVNPNYSKITLKRNVNVLMDSGAFQDKDFRVTCEESLERQLKMENDIGVISQRIVAYDMINDSKITQESNIYLNSKREELEPRQLVFVIQGNNHDECIECFDNLLPLLQKHDCVGFGGVSLAGKIKTILHKLITTLKYVMPKLRDNGITDIHIFGLSSVKVLDAINKVNNENGNYFNISCDSSSVEIRASMGWVWDIFERKFIKRYTKEQKWVDYHPCDITRINIIMIIHTIGMIK